MTNTKLIVVLAVSLLAAAAATALTPCPASSRCDRPTPEPWSTACDVILPVNIHGHVGTGRDGATPVPT